MHLAVGLGVNTAWNRVSVLAAEVHCVSHPIAVGHPLLITSLPPAHQKLQTLAVGLSSSHILGLDQQGER